MDETVNSENSPETLWFKILREKWPECFWNDSSDLKQFADRLGLAIVPVSIMPFREGTIHGKYIDYHETSSSVTCSCSHESSEGRVIEHYLLRLVSVDEAKKEKESDLHFGCLHFRPAPGLWNAFIAPNPTVWFEYANEDTGIDRDFAAVEDSHYKKVLAELDKNNSPTNVAERKGQFMLPLFFGTIPVYVLVVLSQRIDPKFFSCRFLEAMFDSMTEIGESILEEQFEGIWRQYAIELVKGENVIDEDAASFFKEIWGKASARDSFSWIHSLPGHSLKHGKRGALVEQFANDFITQNARFWVRSRKDMLKVFQSNAKKELAFSREDDHDCDGSNGSKTREDAKNKIEKSEWGRVLWVKEKVGGWTNGTPTIDQCKELKAVLLPYDANGKGRMSLALIKAWKEICREYKDIHVTTNGPCEKQVPIGNIDPYELVDSIFWLLRSVDNKSSINAEQKDENGIPCITITLVNIPKSIKIKCDRIEPDEDKGQCCDAYQAIIKLIPEGKLVVKNITAETFDVNINF